MKIGFIGLGIMGSRMAAHLLKAPDELVVFNRTPNKSDALLQKGAIGAESPEHLAQQVDIVFTMLSTPQAVSDVALGKQGFLKSLSPSSIWVDCSTVYPAFSLQMAEAAQKQGVAFLDAPVVGSKQQSETQALLFLVGGPPDTVKTCDPLFQSMGKQVRHVGGHGMGTSLKNVINLLLAESMMAFSEGMAFGQALGLPKAMLLETLLGSPVVAPVISAKRPKIESGDFEAHFPLQWMHKDLHMVTTAAYESGAALPMGNIAKEIYGLAHQKGLGHHDFSAIYQFLNPTDNHS